jgi:rhomboid protease GluP
MFEWVIFLVLLFYLLDQLFPLWRLSQKLCLTHSISYRNSQRKQVQGGIVHGQFYRLWTVALTHADIFHLSANLLSLWSLKTVFAQFSSKYTPTRLWILFFISQLGASLSSRSTYSPHSVSVGVSGAVSGIFGAMVHHVFFSTETPHHPHLQQYKNMVQSNVVLLILLNFCIPGLDYRAHLGGFITGFLVDAVFQRI